MEKYLVTIEFSYSVRKSEEDIDHVNETITIGVYNDFDEACKHGNKELEILEANYKLNPNYNHKERFSKNGGCFGTRNSLISNYLGYLQTPFSFFAKIETLKYGSVQDLIDEFNTKKS
jgi:hypothetical protein